MSTETTPELIRVAKDQRVNTAAGIRGVGDTLIVGRDLEPAHARLLWERCREAGEVADSARRVVRGGQFVDFALEDHPTGREADGWRGR